MTFSYDDIPLIPVPSDHKLTYIREDKPDMANKVKDDGVMRTFEGGATRDTSEDKLDYEAILCPRALRRYVMYMHSNRKQSDGSTRAGDNWQKGIPAEVYMKSRFRHFMDSWLLHRGYREEATTEDQIEAVCGELFNAFGLLHELLKKDEKETLRVEAGRGETHAEVTAAVLRARAANDAAQSAGKKISGDLHKNISCKDCLDVVDCSVSSSETKVCMDHRVSTRGICGIKNCIWGDGCQHLEDHAKCKMFQNHHLNAKIHLKIRDGVIDRLNAGPEQKINYALTEERVKEMVAEGRAKEAELKNICTSCENRSTCSRVYCGLCKYQLTCQHTTHTPHDCGNYKESL